MGLKEIRLYGTCSSGGGLTVNATVPVFGRLESVLWIDGTFDDGIDAVISTQNHEAAATLMTLTNADDDVRYYPREQVHSNLGAALTIDDTEPLVDLPLMAGLPRLVVTSGGDEKTGGCVLFYYED